LVAQSHPSTRGNGLVELRSHPPYGPHLHASGTAAPHLARFPNTIGRYEAAMEFIVERLASKNVSEQERLSTALYVRLEMPNADERARATEMKRPKRPAWTRRRT
jgi:hypothetical protein